MRILRAVILLAGVAMADTQYLVPGSYATITLAEAALPASLSGLGIQDIIASAGTYLETVSISGPTNASASDYIRLRAADGAGHSGLFAGAPHITFSGNVNILSAATSFTVLQDLRVTMTGGSTAATGVLLTTGTNITARRVLVKNECSGSISFNTNAGSNTRFEACISWYTGAGTFASTGFFCGAGNPSAAVENCLSYGAKTGFDRGVIKNSAAASAATACFATIQAGTQYIASSDATATGTGSLTSVLNFAFTSTATGDFHIATSSALAGAGLNLSSAFTTDIDGQTITTWMIGPDFPYVAPVGDAGGKCCRRIHIGVGL